MERIEPSIPNREEFVQFLDTEICNIRAEQQSPGWNLWGIVGAISACIWLMFGVLEGLKVKVDLARLSLLLVLFFLLVDVIQYVVRFLKDEGVHGAGDNSRFRPAAMFWGSNRTHTLLTVVIYVGLIILTLNTALIFNWGYSRGAAIIYFGMIVLVYIFALGMSYTTFFFPNFPRNIKRRFVLASFTAIPGIALYGCVTSAFQTLHAFSVDEWRLAVLLYASIYLFLKLPRQEDNSDELSFLVKTRREMVLNQLDVKTAVKEVEILLLGISLSDVLRDDVFGILNLYKQSTKEYIEVNAVLDLQCLITSKKFSDVTSEDVDFFRSTTNTELDSNLNSLDNRAKLFGKELARLGNKTAWIKGVTGRTPSKLLSVLDKIKEAQKTLNTEMGKANDKVEKIRENMRQWLEMAKLEGPEALAQVNQLVDRIIDGLKTGPKGGKDSRSL